MKLRILISIIFLSVAVGGAVNGLREITRESASSQLLPMPTITPNKNLTPEERKIEQRDLDQKGIKVEEPEIFDDAMLQQMLIEAESKLAALQAFDQTALKSGA